MCIRDRGESLQDLRAPGWPTLLSSISRRSPVYAAAFSPDGKTIASGSSDGTVQHWDLSSGQTQAIMVGGNEGTG